MTEFKFLLLFKYLVGTEWVECKNDKSKASTISESKLLCTEWKE